MFLSDGIEQRLFLSVFDTIRPAPISHFFLAVSLLFVFLTPTRNFFRLRFSLLLRVSRLISRRTRGIKYNHVRTRARARAFGSWLIFLTGHGCGAILPRELSRAPRDDLAFESALDGPKRPEGYPKKKWLLSRSSSARKKITPPRTLSHACHRAAARVPPAR